MPDQHGPTVTIVMPCRNEARHVEDAVRSVLAQEEPPGGFELVVAEGRSDDRTREILEQLRREDPRLRIADNPSGTTPAGLNAAIRLARGEIVVRMDAHTEYAPDYVVRCVETLERTGAANVGGPWVAEGSTPAERAIAAAFASPFAVGGARSHDPGYEGPVDSVYLGCWRREFLHWIGLFDENLIRNQDDELNLRTVLAGGTVWQSPNIRSVYRPRGSVRDLFRQYFQYGYWKVRVIRKHGRAASWRHLVPAAFLLAVAMLSMLSLFVRAPRWGLGILLGVYLLAILGVSAITAARAGFALFPRLPAVFAAFHIGYGLGFLAGVWDFVLLGLEKGRFRGITRN